MPHQPMGEEIHSPGTLPDCHAFSNVVESDLGPISASSYHLNLHSAQDHSGQNSFGI